MNADANFIRNRITELRLKRGISERELSFSLSKAGNYINNITSGKALPLMENFIDMCDFFGITPFEFFYPSIDNPIILKEVYDELTRLSNNNIDKFLEILKVMNPNDLSTFINFIEKITNAKLKNNKPWNYVLSKI